MRFVALLLALLTFNANAAIALRGVGAVSQVATGSMTPGMPASSASGDYALLAVVCQNGETIAASGWTLIFDDINNASSNNTSAALFYRVVTGSGDAPTVTGCTSGSMAVIISYTGVDTGAAVAASSANVDDAVGLTLTADTLTPTAATNHVVWFGLIEAPFSDPSVSGYSGTDPTFTERFDDSNTQGSSWTDIVIADGPANTTSAMGSRSATISTSMAAIYVSYVVSLAESGGGGGSSNAPRMHYYRQQAGQ
jgi:hypothetical protein